MPSTAAAEVSPDKLEEYRRELTGYCYRMLGSGFEADDAVQETMVRAWRAADGFEGRSSVRSWLYRIATNICLDMLRGRQRRALPMDLGPASPPVEALLGPWRTDDIWISPIADDRVLPEQRLDRRRGRAQVDRQRPPLSSAQHVQADVGGDPV